jgi:hypothetical protein
VTLCAGAQNSYCPGKGPQTACPAGYTSKPGAKTSDECVPQDGWMLRVWAQPYGQLSSMPSSYLLNSLQYVGGNFVPAINFPAIVGGSNFRQFVPGTPEHNFAATFTGQVVVRNAGSYTFCTSSDDGSDLSVDGRMVVDNQGLHSMNRVCASTDLSAGAHVLYANFFEQGGAAGFIATWMGPDTGGGEVPVPSVGVQNLAPDGCVSLDGVWRDPNGDVATIRGSAGTWANGRPRFDVTRSDASCNDFTLGFPDDQAMTVHAPVDGMTVPQWTQSGQYVGKWDRAGF